MAYPWCHMASLVHSGLTHCGLFINWHGSIVLNQYLEVGGTINIVVVDSLVSNDSKHLTISIHNTDSVSHYLLFQSSSKNVVVFSVVFWRKRCSVLVSTRLYNIIANRLTFVFLCALTHWGLNKITANFIYIFYMAFFNGNVCIFILIFYTSLFLMVQLSMSQQRCWFTGNWIIINIQ